MIAAVVWSLWANSEGVVHKSTRRNPARKREEKFCLLRLKVHTTTERRRNFSVDELRDHINFTFKELEQALWSSMLQEFGKALTHMLEVVDREILLRRDARRYKVRDLVASSMGTLLGTDVTFTRRRYLDIETGKHVYLLDKVLGLKPYQQTSPGLQAAMLTMAVTTSSYRKAAESLCRLLGFQAASHETIRQMVLETGHALEQAGAKERQDPQGRRKADVLVLETDGMMVSLQQEKRRNVEEKVVTSHEGWKPRYPGSDSFALQNVRQFRTQEAEDFWEEASRWVYSHYDVDEDTLVLINGDRAGWIRRGVDYFPNAMYQVDRFHLKRDLKALFQSSPSTHRALLKALDGDDVTGATFVGRLAEAAGKLQDEKKREEALRLAKDLADVPEATVDYRLRLQARGVCTEGLRGLGAAESQVDRLSDRIKGRGRSWRPRGLAAMMELQCARNTGLFGKIVERIGTWYKHHDAGVVSVKEVARRAVRRVVRKMAPAFQATVPATVVGRTRSGGLSNLFHRINEGGMPV